MQRATLSLALGAALAAAGCAGMTKSYYVDNDTTYHPSLVNYAVGGGEMATEIKGDPFSSGGRPDPEAIASSLTMPLGFPQARFTTRPSDPRRAGHRVVLIFNPLNPAPGGRAACADPDSIAVGPGAGEMRVQAALCSGDYRVSEAMVSGPAGTGPRDPAFQNTINIALAELMPPRDPADPGDAVCGSRC